MSRKGSRRRTRPNILRSPSPGGTDLDRAEAKLQRMRDDGNKALIKRSYNYKSVSTGSTLCTASMIVPSSRIAAAGTSNSPKSYKPAFRLRYVT
ncbi:hypothetical protein HBI55_027840 [Parastagonospora nodorum]|nr:hypothetical protein HBH91_058820 [Parastagonospora nodorum]KAH5803194.1 hypothetical protein HBI94_199030 [Parastagonospora nodorum]KAH6503398.1 hypothetical protein HBI55_027840 [Parastagonospora nodorum]